MSLIIVGKINIKIIPESSEWYYLYVKDSDGCQGMIQFMLFVGVLPYDAITPNGDGYNDTWTHTAILQNMKMH